MTSKTGAVTTTTATGSGVAAGKDSPKTKTEVDGSWGGDFLAAPCNNDSFLLLASTLKRVLVTRQPASSFLPSFVFHLLHICVCDVSSVAQGQRLRN